MFLLFFFFPLDVAGCLAFSGCVRLSCLLSARFIGFYRLLQVKVKIIMFDAVFVFKIRGR